MATIAGAWLCAIPFLRDHATALRLCEADGLATTVSQIKNLDQIKSQIADATSHWQGIQEQSAKTVGTAKELTDRMKEELAEFCTFLKNANDTEKNNLRLEIEKLHRSEGEWLQATVHILDHVFGLHKAALRSGQPGLVAQLDQFQLACRNAVRKKGLVPFAPGSGDAFDAQVHQSADAEVNPTPETRIVETIGPGYTFQGQLARRALVRVQNADAKLSADTG
jgi:molecular chaperone GrpE (heat shock protein)